MDAVTAGFEPFHTANYEVDGWTVVLAVWRDTKHATDSEVPYLAIASTGYTEAGQNLAVMDCDFVLAPNCNVLAEIHQSMQDAQVFEYLLKEARGNLKKLQSKQQGGRVLSN